jgi:hypothetical protein
VIVKGQESRDGTKEGGGRGCYLNHQQVSCMRTKAFLSIILSSVPSSFCAVASCVCV